MSVSEPIGWKAGFGLKHKHNLSFNRKTHKFDHSLVKQAFYTLSMIRYKTLLSLLRWELLLKLPDEVRKKLYEGKIFPGFPIRKLRVLLHRVGLYKFANFVSYRVRKAIAQSNSKLKSPIGDGG